MLSFLKTIWGKRPGWVSVPIKTKDGSWKEVLYQWPDSKKEILKHIKQNRKYNNIYFCPTVLYDRARRKENVQSTNLLWADLDTVNPKKLELKPTIAWETSPGRYQAIWILDKEINPKKAEAINRSLTYSIGADKGGWDLTQVLRIPGTFNHKYDKSPKVKLLWNDGPKYKYKKVKKYVGNGMAGVRESTEIATEIAEDGRTVSEILREYTRLPQKTYDLLFSHPEEVTVGERSDRLWELECLLAEHGMSAEDIARLVQHSAWNKFRGRRNEFEQLLNEAQKAVEHVSAQGRVEVEETEWSPTWETYSGLLGRDISPPRWLVENFWPVMGHGMIAGEPKTYKSVIATDLAVSVASGKPFLGKYKVLESGPVLIIQEENSPRVVKDRMSKIAHERGVLNGKFTHLGGLRAKIFWPKDLPIYFLNNSGFDLTNEECKLLLEEQVRRVKPALIIFDPLYLMLGTVDENSAKDLRPVLNWLIEIKYKYGCGIIILHHWNKAGQSSRGGQRMLGSATLHGWVESALYTSIKNEQEHRIRVEREFREFEKPRNIELQFTLGKPGTLDYSVTILESQEVSDIDLLMIINSSGGMSEPEIVKLLKQPRSTVKRRLDSLVEQGYLEKIKGNKTQKNLYAITKKGRSIDGSDD